MPVLSRHLDGCELTQPFMEVAMLREQWVSVASLLMIRIEPPVGGYFLEKNLFLNSKLLENE